MDEKMTFDRNEVEKLVAAKDWKGLLEYDFRGADLSGMCFGGADLAGIDFSGADFSNTDFQWASLRNVSFSSSFLEGADFRGTDITGTYFADACMDGIIMDETTSHYHTRCPEEGEFIGYKQVRDNKYGPYIAELKIPAHALRSSATSNKCRCSEAEVMSITRLDGTDNGIDIVRSWRNPDILYKVGEMVKADGFDRNRWHVCAPGIHFFMTREEAVDYILWT